MNQQKSFLVSCVGTYANCGNGTGGFVCIHGNQTIVIDELDCTGLFLYRDTVYRFIRTLKRLVGYDPQGIKYFVSLPTVKDCHDLVVRDDQIICVSTGTNEIQWYNHLGEIEKKWKADGEGDSWHLNSICVSEEKIYVSAFGEFKKFREWGNEENRNKGFVFNLDSGKKVIEGLSSPHHPRYINEKLFVCNSLTHSLIIKDSCGKVTNKQLNGFTRGLTYDENYLYVGESANRKESNNNYSFLAVIDLDSLEVIRRIKIPFPEIYDVVLISSELANKVAENPDRFRLFKSEVAEFRNKLEESYKEMEILKSRLGYVENKPINYSFNRVKQKAKKFLFS